MKQPALKAYTTELDTHNGMMDGQKAAAAELLQTALADTYQLLVATQGVHWNVQGPLFYSVHKLTEDQYQELFTAIDDLAERIRSLGFRAPQSLASIAEPASLDAPEPGDDLENQIQYLIDANEHIARTLRTAIDKLDNHKDLTTSDMFTQRIGVHEQNAWMLRATVN